MSEHKNKKDNVVEFDRGAHAAAEAAEPRQPANAETDAAGAIVPASESPDAAAAGQVIRLQAEKDELMQSMVRRQADFENYRKRVERERQDDSRRGSGRVIDALIPVLDAFGRALKAHDDPAYEEYRKGLDMIYRQLWDTLAKQGLERIVAEGKRFDPNFHQAVERVESDEHPDGAIVEVLQDGYLFNGRVLRPSIVRVAVHTDVHPEGSGGHKPAAHRRAN